MRYRLRETFENTKDPQVYKKIFARITGCGCCPPNRGENANGRNGRVDRYKSARKGRCSGKLNPVFREKESPYIKYRTGAPNKRRYNKVRPWMYSNEWIDLQ